MSTSQSDKPHKVVCHAPGPRCLGCDHYKGLIAECVYAIPPSAETDAWPTKNDYLIVCAALGNATNAWAALVKHIGNDVIPGSAFEALIRDMNVALDDSRPFVQSATPTAAPHDEGHEEQQVDTGRAVAAPSALAKRIREECKSVLYMNAPNLVDLALLAADALESRLLDTMPLSPKSENSRDNAESRQIGDSIPTAARCVSVAPEVLDKARLEVKSQLCGCCDEYSNDHAKDMANELLRLHALLSANTKRNDLVKRLLESAKIVKTISKDSADDMIQAADALSREREGK